MEQSLSQIADEDTQSAPEAIKSEEEAFFSTFVLDLD
jgi:hypothetical protein